MGLCDGCRNDYDKAFTIIQGDLKGTFDSFECAIHALAPECAHCAKKAGVTGIDDRS